MHMKVFAAGLLMCFAASSANAENVYVQYQDLEPLNFFTDLYHSIMCFGVGARYVRPVYIPAGGGYYRVVGGGCAIG